MLVDDNDDDNFYHQRVIRRSEAADKVVLHNSAETALQHLRFPGQSSQPLPAILFLDINMPGMNGWDFIEEYSTLDKDLRAGIFIVMLTTSESPDDSQRAKDIDAIADFRTKPLTQIMLAEILEKYHRAIA